MENTEFKDRLKSLRKNKGVSARDMSISMGQDKDVISNIENGGVMPSMPIFFSICKFLNVTPAEFFDTEANNPSKVKELTSAAKNLSNTRLDVLITLAKAQ
ncbi:MAG: helix-turn-helix transcriptional regulator [Clostridiales bacterium]|nr:helix-turn-helix transcriptional regulator [Clostridiales bacterium]